MGTTQIGISLTLDVECMSRIRGGCISGVCCWFLCMQIYRVIARVSICEIERYERLTGRFQPVVAAVKLSFSIIAERATATANGAAAAMGGSIGEWGLAQSAVRLTT